MRELRDRGLRMALLTNNVREWEPLWRAKLPELDEIFEVVVDSAFVGMRKPEPRDLRAHAGAARGRARARRLRVHRRHRRELRDARESLGMTAVHFLDADQAIAEIEAAVGRE